MTERIDRGTLLRRWREAHGLKLATIGRALPDPVVESTVQQWESGQRLRGPNREQLEAIDRRLGAGGCFVDMYEAVRTPDALDADQDWCQNFQGESGPCWAWLRTAEGQPVVAVLDAGPFRVDVIVPPGDGVFVQAYGFASNPAVHARLERPGWVDFGYGTIPASLELPISEAIDVAVMGPGAGRDQALALAPRLVLRDEFGGKASWFEDFRARFGQRVEAARHLLTRTFKAPIGTNLDLGDADAPDEHAALRWTGERFRKLREARGLALDDVARLASQLAPDLPPISRDHVQRLELGSSPRVTELLPRLDMTYRADGRTCVATVRTEQSGGRHLVWFPDYWIGPIWIHFIGRSPAGERAHARLIWKPWRKSLYLSHDVVVTCRRSVRGSEPLAVDVPPGWEMRGGVGVHPSAVDVNEGWGFIDRAMAKEALAHYYDVVLQALRQGREQG